MGVTVAVTRAAASGSTGTQDFTTTDLGGLTPVAALFIVTQATADGAAADHAQMSVGAATGSTNRWCISGSSEHGQSTTDTARTRDSDEVIRINTPGDTAVDGEADFDSFITNGVRIDWASVTGNAELVTVILFAGTDVSAHANSVNVGATLDLTTDVTAPGFQPEIVLFYYAGGAIDSSSGTNNFHASFGVARDAGGGVVEHRAHGVVDKHGQGTAESFGLISDDYAVIFMKQSANIDHAIEVSDFDANGFSVTTRVDGGNNDDLPYLALSFSGAVSTWIGTITTPTATGNDSVTAPGFTPQAVLGAMTFFETIDTIPLTANNNTWGINAFDSDDQFANSVSVERSAVTSNTQSLADNTAVELPADDGSASLTASFVSFNANGFTLNYSAVEAAAKYFWALAIEEEAAAGAIEESMSIAKIVDLTDENDLSAVDNLAIGKVGNIVLQNILDLGESVSVARLNDVSLDTTMAMLDSIALGKINDVSVAYLLTMTGSAEISRVNAISVDTLMTILDSISTDKIGNVDLSSQIDMREGASIGRISDIDLSDIMTALDDIAISIGSDLSLDSLLNIVDSINLNKIDNISIDALMTLIESIDLNKVDSVSIDTLMTLIESISASRIATIILADEMTMGNSLSLGEILNISISSSIDGADQVSIAIAKIADILLSSTLDASDNVTIASERNISLDSVLSMSESINASKIVGILTGGGFLVTGSISLDAVYDVNAGETATYAENVELPRIGNTSLQDALDAGATISIDAHRNLTVQGVMTIGDSVTVGQVVGIVVSSSVPGGAEEQVTILFNPVGQDGIIGSIIVKGIKGGMISS